ncbi:helix-turn-helix transcriptional regulator [Enterococcus gallinarum]|nr:helix-turn-helix transcriptional regulator [Enterococcus gallinarum]
MECLKELRKEKKLKQEQVAMLLLVSYSHYVKLENGFVKPSYQLLKRIKQTFPDIDMNQFFK